MSLRRFFRRTHDDAELNQEIDLHLQQETDDNIERGLPPEEARRQAYLKLGNPRRVHENLWQQNTLSLVDSLWRDIAYTTRTLARAPVFTGIAIFVMALGIGATVALFTVVHGVLFRPLPFPDQDRLAIAYEAQAHGTYKHTGVAGGTFRSWKAAGQDLSDMALLAGYDFNLAGSSGQLPESIHAQLSSWNLLSLLGVQPAAGRFFMPIDDTPGSAKTAIITWGLWQRRFAGKPSAIGSTIFLDAQPYTIIGVLPAWFHYRDVSTQLWVTIYPSWPPEYLTSMESHSAHNFQMIGRLKPGVSFAQAQAELSGISAQVAKQFGGDPWVYDAANVQPLVNSIVSPELHTALYALLAASGCLLLIACLNIANLLIARSANRRRESAIRAALGGNRGRRIRSQIVDSILLALSGGLLGTGFAFVAVRWLLHTRPDLPRAESIHLDMFALLVAIAISTVCGIASGLLPALTEDDRHLLHALQESSRSHGGSNARVRLRRTLLAMEVGLTVVLLIASGLLLKSYSRLRSTDLGCNTTNVLTMSISLPDATYTPAKRVLFFDQLLLQIRRQPGVYDAGLSTVLPGEGSGEDDGYTVHEDPPLPAGKGLAADIRWVDPGYFAAMQIPLKRGRVFSPDERGPRSRFAIISDSLARQVFAGRDPMGKHIDDSNNAEIPTSNASNEIIGIVGDTRGTPANEPKPTIYYPIYGGLRAEGTLAIRTFSNPLGSALPIQKIIAGMDPNLAVADILTLDQAVGKSTMDTSFDTTLLLTFAILSLILAAVGLFGVLSFVVAQRTSEIGIRIALGAQRQQVLRTILIDGLQPALIGLVIGLAVSAAAVRLIRSMLYQTKPFDLQVFAAVSATLLLVSAAACLFPAWRASRLDPMQALRTE